jgi:hypothetical protein
MTFQNKRPLYAFLLSLSVLTALVVAAEVGTRPKLDPARRQEQESPAERMTLKGKAPKGTWAVSAIPDVSQATDTTTPVVLSGLSSLFGRKELGGFLKVIAVKLTNRSAKDVVAVRLGWIIVTAEDRLAMKPDKEAKKAEGATPLFETHIAPRKAKKADSPIIDFLAQAKPLLKNDALDGEYIIKVRVVEAEFADGTIWREQDA